jgi:hypothetical protein
LLVLAGVIAMPLVGLAGNGKQGGAPGIGPLALEPLTPEETATLVWMREEEKMARDLYHAFGLYYADKIFVNIEASEQKHFDAIGKKLELYGIADPALEGYGTFTNPTLGALYLKLLGDGMAGLVPALNVGVVVETTDLTDLEAAIDQTDSKPLLRTYQHLLDGSERHLAAFLRHLKRLGITL